MSELILTRYQLPGTSLRDQLSVTINLLMKQIKSNKYVPLVPAPSKESMHEVENLVVLRNNTKKVIFRFITHHMVPVVK